MSTQIQKKCWLVIYGDFRHKPRTENEEIVGDLKKKFEIIDHAPRNMKMVHNPSWKDPNKQRWMEPVNIYTEEFTFLVITIDLPLDSLINRLKDFQLQLDRQ